MAAPRSTAAASCCLFSGRATTGDDSRLPRRLIELPLLRSLKPGLHIYDEEALNAEPALDLLDEAITPVGAFFTPTPTFQYVKASTIGTVNVTEPWLAQALVEAYL